MQLSRYFTNARRRDFGFVAFISRESAIACVEGINSAQLGDGEIKVFVPETLTRISRFVIIL